MTRGVSCSIPVKPSGRTYKRWADLLRTWLGAETVCNANGFCLSAPVTPDWLSRHRSLQSRCFFTLQRGFINTLWTTLKDLISSLIFNPIVDLISDMISKTNLSTGPLEAKLDYCKSCRSLIVDPSGADLL